MLHHGPHAARFQLCPGWFKLTCSACAISCCAQASSVAAWLASGSATLVASRKPWALPYSLNTCAREAGAGAWCAPGAGAGRWRCRSAMLAAGTERRLAGSLPHLVAGHHLVQEQVEAVQPGELLLGRQAGQGGLVSEPAWQGGKASEGWGGVVSSTAGRGLCHPARQQVLGAIGAC